MFTSVVVVSCIFFSLPTCSCIVRHRGTFDSTILCECFNIAFPSSILSTHTHTRECEVLCIHNISFQTIWYCFDFERERKSPSPRAIKVISMPCTINDVIIIVQFDEEAKKNRYATNDRARKNMSSNSYCIISCKTIITNHINVIISFVVKHQFANFVRIRTSLEVHFDGTRRRKNGKLLTFGRQWREQKIAVCWRYSMPISLI